MTDLYPCKLCGGQPESYQTGRRYCANRECRNLGNAYEVEDWQTLMKPEDDRLAILITGLKALAEEAEGMVSPPDGIHEDQLNDLLKKAGVE